MDGLMNTTPPGGGKVETMTSLEIADVVKSRHDDVKRSIKRLAERGTIQLPPMADVKNHQNQTVEVYLVIERDSYVVVAQLSPEFTAALVDHWQKYKHQAPQIPTTAEAFANAFRMLADAERVQTQQNAAIAEIGQRVEIIEQLTPLKAKPQNAESLSEIRARMNSKYALSQPIVDTVLNDLPYSFRPFGMVKNSHEDAQGSSYAVYWIRDVSALFKRFVSECEPHSAVMFKHQSISRTFRLKK